MRDNGYGFSNSSYQPEWLREMEAARPRRGGPQQARPQRPLPQRRSPQSDLPEEEDLGPAPSPSARASIDPLELFLAYHLGITADDRYKATNLHDVARRFGVSPGAIKQALQDYGMDPDTVINSEFDMAMAQVDIQVAPEGVSRRELGRNLFEEFKRARKGTRDWARQLAEDAKENARVFGRR